MNERKIIIPMIENANYNAVLVKALQHKDSILFATKTWKQDVREWISLMDKRYALWKMY